MFSKENIMHTIHGILFVGLFALAANQIANIKFIKSLRLSPLIIGILIGMIYANTLRNHLPKEWVPGIIFSTKQLLRFAIILYGFRITFQNIAAVGIAGIIASTLMVTLTFIIGYIVGTKVLKLDRDTTILTSAGSSICGAAAVLATEPVVKAEAYKSAIAVATVVLFGSIAMFLYPFLYKAGFIHLSPKSEGIYIGSTIHEVAHVVAAASAISPDVAKDAVIVKMIRVMLIAPYLIILGIFLAMKSNSKTKTKVTIPWFAVLFILVAGFNSFNLLSENIVQTINTIDTFLLTMAMTALGMETNINKFKGVGMKPIYLAGILFIWLLFGGYFITKFAISVGS
ncbi:YeiH family putative sulfate export transporter [Caminibacter mediatlanticus TB-2]|uniref:YeiH family putative sulfate export transporter n=1 Tax=Caminibacter mediatlanticus TB-2 TaxID=391592 RepID=A0ABX5V6E9_9BACT|nr:YeiH family protein [Caminibacter mediatlanticus]QCT93853.1 YeiH family putative sulfate export transporter [Caminibacter mediatlanticus TB-2]